MLPSPLPESLDRADAHGRPPRELNHAATPIVASLRQVSRSSPYLAISDATADLELLPTFDRLEAVWVAAADARMLSLLAQCHNIRAISLESNTIESLAPLGACTTLRHVSIAAARRLTSIHALAELPQLRTLLLWNVPRMTDLESVGTLTGLIGLQFGGAMWRTHSLPTLAPLSRLRRLRYLDLPATRVASDSLEPLAALKELRELFLPNIYAIEEFAALAASLPNTSGDCLRSHWEGTLPCAVCGTARVLETGRGGRFVCPRCAPERVAKRAAKFDALVSRGGFHSRASAS